ncbi:MAG: phBC6A51 family helix-turn-helix protein [Bacteroidales bacterium]|nr:phBC6A51 family helix-turn-helix protein [Bacteroidales bacterium]
MTKRSRKHREVVDARKARERALLLEQLKKLPIVSAACEKTGVSRPTYYRWRQEDHAFAKEADEALEFGTQLVSDMAESQLLTAIRDGNLGAVMYWLKHRNPHYNNKLEVTARIRQENDVLTPEQEAAITEAFRLASISENDVSLPSPPSHEQGKPLAGEAPAADAL